MNQNRPDPAGLEHQHHSASLILLWGFIVVKARGTTKEQRNFLKVAFVQMTSPVPPYAEESCDQISFCELDESGAKKCILMNA